MSCEQPREPLPAPLRGNEFGTFTHRSIVQRLPEIGRRTLAANAFTPKVTGKIEGLLSEIPGGPIRHLEDDAPDAVRWSDYVEPYLGNDWLDPPWFFIEHYFYRRLMEATGYFTSGSGFGVDPFRHQKRWGLAGSEQAIYDLCAQALNLLTRKGWDSEGLSWIVSSALWGNKADLSMWPAGPDGDESVLNVKGPPDHALVDDTPILNAFLYGLVATDNRIDFLIDNAGFELVVDLILATFLLKKSIARTVKLHTKIHPTFVSDAMIADIWTTVYFISKVDDLESRKIGNMMIGYLNSGRLLLETHPFWTSPLPAWEMPADLRDDLKAATLIISKGDAHYRRLLGDRHWPHQTPVSQILCYLPSSLLALRTLKSEVAAGIEKDEVNRASQRDPDWLVSGQWGIIQFLKKQR